MVYITLIKIFIANLPYFVLWCELKIWHEGKRVPLFCQCRKNRTTKQLVLCIMCWQRLSFVFYCLSG